MGTKKRAKKASRGPANQGTKRAAKKAAKKKTAVRIGKKSKKPVAGLESELSIEYDEADLPGDPGTEPY